MKHSGQQAQGLNALLGRAESLGLEVGDEQVRAVQRASDWLARLARARGLSGYEEPDHALLRGMAPALSYFAFAQAPRRGRVADLGAGAGALGATLAIVAPGLHVDLVDRAERAFTACELLAAELGLDNLRARRLEVGREAPLGDAYDAVVFRALAAGGEALGLAGSIAAPGGFVAAWHRARDAQFGRPPPDFERLDCLQTGVPDLVVTGYRFCPP